MENKITDKPAGITWMQFLGALFFVSQGVFWFTSVYKDLKFEASVRQFEKIITMHEVVKLNDEQDKKELQEDIVEWQTKYQELKEQK